MASLIKEIRAVRMWGGTHERDREQGRKLVLLEVAYGLFGRRVYTLCLRLTASAPEAEEATVRVFARLGRELGRGWDETRVHRRLVELAADEALSRLRAQSSNERLGGRAAKWGTPHAANVGEPADEAGCAAATSSAAPAPLDLTRLDALAAGLPIELRAAFVLRDREGLGVSEIAALMRVGEADVRGLVHRARTELRRMLVAARTQEGEEQEKEGST